MTTRDTELSALSRAMRGEEMIHAEEVAAMLRLHGLGLGVKRLAREFGCARTVRRYTREFIRFERRESVFNRVFQGVLRSRRRFA